MNEDQCSFDFMAIKTYKVGCRVEGDPNIQIYEVEAVDHIQAGQFVEEGVLGSNPVLVLIKNDAE